MTKKSWISPAFKQCFVTAGVSINMMNHGIALGFGAAFIPQVQESRDIYVEAEMMSWIVSITGFIIIIGALIVPQIMTVYGRRPASIISAILMTSGWIIIASTTNGPLILFARFIQGISTGFTSIMGSVLVGEYTSPKYRGMLLTTLSLAMMIGITVVHALGTFLHWQRIALISSAISYIDLIISIYSPESPSFLVNKGRYDECRKVFHWLRGFDEDEELEKLIKADMSVKAERSAHVNSNKVSVRLKRKIIRFIDTFKKKQVYKSIIVTAHLFAMNAWAGGLLFDVYAKNIVDILIGPEISYPLVIISLDVQRLVSNTATILFIKKFRRRLVLVLTMSLNIVCYVVIALYVYLRTHHMLGFDHPLIGTLLLHTHMFTHATGGGTPNIIAGEILPLKHRGFCGMFGILFFSINCTINLKTAPDLLSSLGLPGAYLVYASLVAYFTAIPLLILPETKDRTLLDIEEEFRGEPLVAESLVKNTSSQKETEII